MTTHARKVLSQKYVLTTVTKLSFSRPFSIHCAALKVKNEMRGSKGFPELLSSLVSVPFNSDLGFRKTTKAFTKLYDHVPVYF